ncbi:hypothetical protein FJY63_04595 [Candidatus Sumerlaeota bacterium]|nr:hypothetical protein [Candidatus Sumerlaeota bacterium]
MSDGCRFGFVPLGIGGPFSQRHYPVSLLLVLGEQFLLIDCPSPLPKMLYEASVKSSIQTTLSDIHEVVLTHLHGDHSSGLECLGFDARFNRGRTVKLWTLPEVVADLWEHRLSGSMAYDFNSGLGIVKRFRLEDFFDIQLLDPKRPSTICGATVHVRPTHHPVPCFGLKVVFQDRSIGYSGDTIFDLDHIAFLADCDVIVHETGSGIHASYEQLASLPRAIRDKMFLIHVGDGFVPDGPDPLPVLEEGRFYSI